MLGLVQHRTGASDVTHAVLGLGASDEQLAELDWVKDLTKQPRTGLEAVSCGIDLPLCGEQTAEAPERAALSSGVAGIPVADQRRFEVLTGLCETALQGIPATEVGERDTTAYAIPDLSVESQRLRVMCERILEITQILEQLPEIAKHDGRRQTVTE